MNDVTRENFGLESVRLYEFLQEEHADLFASIACEEENIGGERRVVFVIGSGERRITFRAADRHLSFECFDYHGGIDLFPDPERGFAEFVAVLRQILAGGKVVVAWTTSEGASGGELLDRDSYQHYAFLWQGAARVRVRSWTGAIDRIEDVPAAQGLNAGNPPAGRRVSFRRHHRTVAGIALLAFGALLAMSSGWSLFRTARSLAPLTSHADALVVYDMGDALQVRFNDEAGSEHTVVFELPVALGSLQVGDRLAIRYGTVAGRLAAGPGSFEHAYGPYVLLMAAGVLLATGGIWLGGRARFGTRTGLTR